MPVRKCSNGKYRIGSGDCIYHSHASAERAYKGYLSSKNANEGVEMTKINEYIDSNMQFSNAPIDALRKVYNDGTAGVTVSYGGKKVGYAVLIPDKGWKIIPTMRNIQQLPEYGHWSAKAFANKGEAGMALIKFYEANTKHMNEDATDPFGGSAFSPYNNEENLDDRDYNQIKEDLESMITAALSNVKKAIDDSYSKEDIDNAVDDAIDDAAGKFFRSEYPEFKVYDTSSLFSDEEVKNIGKEIAKEMNLCDEVVGEQVMSENKRLLQLAGITEATDDMNINKPRGKVGNYGQYQTQPFGGVEPMKIDMSVQAKSPKQSNAEGEKEVKADTVKGAKAPTHGEEAKTGKPFGEKISSGKSESKTEAKTEKPVKAEKKESKKEESSEPKTEPKKDGKKPEWLENAEKKAEGKEEKKEEPKEEKSEEKKKKTPAEEVAEMRATLQGIWSKTLTEEKDEDKCEDCGCDPCECDKESGDKEAVDEAKKTGKKPAWLTKAEKKAEAKEKKKVKESFKSFKTFLMEEEEKKCEDCGKNPCICDDTKLDEAPKNYKGVGKYKPFWSNGKKLPDRKMVNGVQEALEGEPEYIEPGSRSNFKVGDKVRTKMMGQTPGVIKNLYPDYAEIEIQGTKSAFNPKGYKLWRVPLTNLVKESTVVEAKKSKDGHNAKIVQRTLDKVNKVMKPKKEDGKKILSPLSGQTAKDKK